MGHEIEFARINFRPQLIPTRGALKSTAARGTHIRKSNIPVTQRTVSRLQQQIGYQMPNTMQHAQRNNARASKSEPAVSQF
jgi:hypothetical protein